MKKNKLINLEKIKSGIKKELINEGPEEIKEAEEAIEAQSEIVHSWEADEYAFQEKGFKWYLYGGIVLAIMVVVAIWTGNYLMAVTFALLSAIIYIYSKRKPKKIKFVILQGGIDAGGVSYSFDDLNSFWIFYNDPPHDAYVSIQKKKKYAPYVQLPIGEADPTEIKKALLKFITEKKHNEEFSNKVEKFLKF